MAGFGKVVKLRIVGGKPQVPGAFVAKGSGGWWFARKLPIVSGGRADLCEIAVADGSGIYAWKGVGMDLGGVPWETWSRGEGRQFVRFWRVTGSIVTNDGSGPVRRPVRGETIKVVNAPSEDATEETPWSLDGGNIMLTSAEPVIGSSAGEFDREEREELARNRTEAARKTPVLPRRARNLASR